jgi:putative peptidoglycan lipid II flippase
LPLILAIQLVATLALPAIARAFAQPGAAARAQAVVAARGAFALAWALACAAAAALLVGAPAVSQLLFGWGRMDSTALARIAQWGTTAAWGLLPQALIAVAMAVLASQRRLKPAVLAYAGALGALGVAAALGLGDGAALMRLLNLLFCGVAAVSVAALGPDPWKWLPWRPMAVSLAALLLLAAAEAGGVRAASLPAGLGLAAMFAVLVMATTWVSSTELRETLRR